MDTVVTSLQRDIIRALGVEQTFELAEATERRVAFLADYLTQAGASSYVLGISGGVDSTVAGRLAQLACERVGARFIAVRLPYGKQGDAHDAEDALSFIRPHVIEEVDIKPAVDALHAGTSPASGWKDERLEDLVKGNIKARQRMVVQYAIAGRENGLVVGTDHAAEAVMGFFTKHGDGACDVVPLAGLVKSYVRAIGEHLGAPAHLVTKVPTADLEDDRPGLPDEAAYGVSYAQIDSYLVGEEIEASAREVIERAYRVTAHKRAPAAGPPPR
ncbi:MAG TPA: ammonia-dependent NAD(+) synthetase [Nocardioidaceae bacterium]|nr:ammonia-dependent NAD(+) synthetase [Nocardioidaceae bacterium]